MRRSPVQALPGFARVCDAFASPFVAPADLPDDLRATVQQVEAWNTEARALCDEFAKRSVFRRGLGLGRVIGDAIRLQRAVRTRRIDHWLLDAPREARQTFENWRDAFFVRCDALAALSTEGLVASDLAMPEDGVLTMLRRNPSQLARLLGARVAPFGTVSVLMATLLLVVREWDFFGSFTARQLRRSGVAVSTKRGLRAMRRVNAAAGRTLITHRHLEPLLAAYAAFEDRGISVEDADSHIVRALEQADATSGKPWKGLVRLYELVVYSGVDPRSAAWPDAFADAMRGAVEYTHVPGREWLIRDYQVGKHLMQIDGKVAPGERWAALQQGRSSLATGYLRGGQDRTEFGRRYSKPLAAFLDSMVVAEGADHQRQRKPFLPFFSQGAILQHAAFVEQTVSALLDHTASVARAQSGRFDLRTDFAYRFPIRVICHVLELPPDDVLHVQRWAETSVRAMDTEAGVSFRSARDGQHASDEFREYLEAKLAAAREGRFAGALIGAIARDETLTEAERVANLGVLVFAGFETTTGLISRGVEALLRHREQFVHLRDSLVPIAPVTVQGNEIPDREWRWLAWASTRPARTIDAERLERLVALTRESPAAAARYEQIRHQEVMLDHAIEELLRWTAPGTVVPLTASKDVDVPLESSAVIKGCPHSAGSTFAIKRGETIAVAVDELNRRCPVGAGRFDHGQPNRLDVTREENSAHLSFGLRHSCIGAFLAKENAKRALEGILRRFPDLELAGDPIPQEMELFSGLASLPVRSNEAT